MKNNPLPILLSLASLLCACTVTGPADDGFQNSNEWVDNGRLVSDDNSGYRLYSTEEEQTDEPAVETSSDSELDYTAYQEWWDAKKANSPQYQKFRMWQEFEEYQHWKEKSKTE